MLPLVAVSLIVGALLGTKFRVFVLLPGIILGVAAIVVAGILHPIEVGTSIIGYATGLQLGYLIGAATRQFLSGGGLAHLTRRPLAPPAH
jgi:hypothetical protein